jgi:hypothetical protein
LAQAADGRADLLVKCAGLALGYGERQPEAAHYQRMAELCLAAGADKTLIQRWIDIGRRACRRHRRGDPLHRAPPRRLTASDPSAPMPRGPGGRAGPRSCWPARSLPGRIPVLPGLGALLAGCIQSTLGRVEPVTGGIERTFGLLHRGRGFSEHILGRGQPAPQLGQLPD